MLLTSAYDSHSMPFSCNNYFFVASLSTELTKKYICGEKILIARSQFPPVVCATASRICFDRKMDQGVKTPRIISTHSYDRTEIPFRQVTIFSSNKLLYVQAPSAISSARFFAVGIIYRSDMTASLMMIQCLYIERC